MNGFTLIADPTRRRILDVLRAQGSDVGGLVDVLRMPQPLVSKHLRVLRDAGAVTATIAGKRRVYRLAADPLPDVLAWVLPYQQLWAASFDRLDRALEQDHGGPGHGGPRSGERDHDRQDHDRQDHDRQDHENQDHESQDHDEERTP